MSPNCEYALAISPAAAEAAEHGVLAIDLSVALKLHSRKQAQSAVADAVRAMNAAYGWLASEGLA